MASAFYGQHEYASKRSKTVQRKQQRRQQRKRKSEPLQIQVGSARRRQGPRGLRPVLGGQGHSCLVRDAARLCDETERHGGDNRDEVQDSGVARSKDRLSRVAKDDHTHA